VRDEGRGFRARASERGAQLRHGRDAVDVVVAENDDALAASLEDAARTVTDPIWRMPLWDGYDEMLKSDLADLSNAADSPMAGAVTAALFLRRFIPQGTPWAHFDTFAWRPSAKPGRPKGGDAMGLRAALAMLQRRYSS